MIAGNGAAFKCGPGYLCNAGSESVRGNESCPIDNYCVDGTQTLCAAATLSTVGGIEAASECVECPPGKICENNSVGVIDCPAGKFCPGKVLNLAGVSDCTAGNYCPTGSKNMIKCPPGTFVATANATVCTPCTVGHFCETSGLNAAT